MLRLYLDHFREYELSSSDLNTRYMHSGINKNLNAVIG
jgi:hypothetical protein